MITQCTFPGCAPPPASWKARTGATSALSAPRHLRAEPERTVGRQVILTWDSVPGAVRYRVYRYTNKAPLDFFPPGGITVNIPGIGPVTIPQDILSGKLDWTCGPIGDKVVVCALVKIVKGLNLAGNFESLPAPLMQVGTVSVPSYFEPAPTDFQSMYFVRAEDSQGNLSPPSNFAGAPSKAFF